MHIETDFIESTKLFNWIRKILRLLLIIFKYFLDLFKKFGSI